MLSNRRRYLTSLAMELSSQSTRIRDLIGDSHWLTDGHHKEYLLTGLLRRHLPAGVLATRGFVVSPYEQNLCSREQDILIVDTLQESPIFHQGGIIVTFPQSVLASISVKTKMGQREVASSVEGLATVLDVAANAVSKDWACWCGAFFFDETPLEHTPTLFYKYFSEAAQRADFQRRLENSEQFPIVPGDIFASAQNYVFSVDNLQQLSDGENMSWRIRGYECRGLATAVFLAGLLGHIASKRGVNESSIREWTDDGSINLLNDGVRNYTRSI